MNRAVFLIGLLLAILSHPKIKDKVFARLMNEGLVTPKQLPPEKSELIRFAGPNLSLLLIGVILMIIGAILEYT